VTLTSAASALVGAATGLIRVAGHARHGARRVRVRRRYTRHGGKRDVVNLGGGRHAAVRSL